MVCELDLNKAAIKRRSQPTQKNKNVLSFKSILLRTLRGLPFILIVHYTLNEVVIFIQHLE